MAATLTNADPSPRRAKRSPFAVTGSEPSDPTPVTEAVFRTIADGCPHSLGEIAGATGTAANPDGYRRVVEEVDRLRRLGMSIERVGDEVVAAAVVPLEREAIARRLNGSGDRNQRPPWKVEVVFATGSTNSDLLGSVRTAVQAHAFEGPVLRAAEIQLAGRGRLGRRWSSAPGASLTVSFALTVGRRLADLDGVTLVCGLAAREVLAGYGVDPRLKWPNDVLVNGRKLAGTLVEAHAAAGSTTLVVGIGINLLPALGPDDPHAGPAALQRTSLGDAGIAPVDRNELAARLARSLEHELSGFERRGFRAFAARWNAVDAFRDRPVALDAAADSKRSGIARGVDERGALLVDIGTRRERIVAGDVSLRPLEESAVGESTA